MKKHRVLFLYKDRSEYGKSYGLANSATFVCHFLKHHGIESDIQIARDSNHIDRLVTEYNPTHVIIEALWVTPEKMHELLSIHRHKSKQWVIRIHSRPSFLAHEGMAFQWLLGYKKLRSHNLTIAPNTEEFTNDLGFFGLRVAYLPNIYYPSAKEKEIKSIKYHHTIDIGCFGAIRPMKNHLTQAIAAVEFAKKSGLNLNFHVNVRAEGGGDAVLKNLRYFFENTKHHNLVEHEWFEHGDFIDLARKMDLGMQVSLTETFNIVAADFVYAGVPIVGSPQITWLPEIFQANPNSTESIKKKLLFANSSIGHEKLSLAKKNLTTSSRLAGKIWIDFIEYHIVSAGEDHGIQSRTRDHNRDC